MKRYWMGLDIGGTKCAVLLATVDAGVHIEDKIRFETEAEKGFESVYARLLEAMDVILARNKLTSDALRAIGVSCGGPLDSRKGVILCPPNLPGFVNIPLRDMLQERFHVPVFIQNDANACALVEWKLGAGRGTENMIFLTMGTGMGAGVIAEGRLIRGNTDMGGEVGHIRLTEDGPVGFGKAGSFEGYTSGGGIQRQAAEQTRVLLKTGRTPAWVRDGHTAEEMDARLMAQYARSGDGDALAFWDSIGDKLGKGLAILVDSFNPERIVIGSVFVRCEDLLRPAMEAALRKEAIPHAMKGLEILPAATGESLGDLASIMTALYALGIDPLKEETEHDPAVLAHFERLFFRYPQLEENREQIMQGYKLLEKCFRNGGKLLVCGNGGSCADSQHIVAELMKGFYLKRMLPKETAESIGEYMDVILPDGASLLQQGLPAIALSEHDALSSAVANDNHPLLPYAQQVVGYGRPGDVLLAISTSGNSVNVALAVAAAKGLGLNTLGLTGSSGGKLKAMCDCAITVPGSVPADVQELHLPVYHTLCAMLEEKFFGKGK